MQFELTWFIIHIHTDYSYLKASTGFLAAAFMLCQLTVSIAINTADSPARAKIHQPSSDLYAKRSSHLFSRYTDTGIAITNATPTHFKKSELTNSSTSIDEAPFTFLRPISFLRLEMLIKEIPNKPIIDRIAARIVNAPIIRSWFVSRA